MARKQYYQDPIYKDYLLGAMASVGACTFTNPMEVIKTRLQLQGELALTAHRPFKGFIDCATKLVKYEGIFALQKGLIPGYWFQIFMNGTRLGTFGLTRRMLGVRKPEETRFWFLRNLLAGASAGVFAACVGSPFYLIKTRMQSQANNSYTAVGHQYNYKGMFDGMLSIYKNEGGFKGLTRGIEGIALRVAFGSATQLSTYEQSKVLVLRTGLFDDNVFAHLAASCVSGLAVCTVMNPFDVVCTRLYNQKVSSGQGALYTGPIDCFVKTTRAEGFRALYKGYGAHFLRIAPHTILTFLFWEQLKKSWDRRFRGEEM